MATPPPSHAACDGASYGATETIQIILTKNGQEDDGDSGEVRQWSIPAQAGNVTDAVAEGLRHETSEIGKNPSCDGVNDHLTGNRPVTGQDGTAAEQALPGKHPNVTLRSHPDRNSTTPRQLLKSVAAELPSCKKESPTVSSDDHSLNAAGSDQDKATNGSAIRGQDDPTGQFSRATSSEASAHPDSTPNAAYETAEQRAMRLDMLAWQQGRILPQAWQPQWSPE